MIGYIYAFLCVLIVGLASALIVAWIRAFGHELEMQEFHESLRGEDDD